MSFQFLSTIPVWTTTIPWTDTGSNPVDSLLGLFGVSPFSNIYTTVVNTVTFSHFSPLQLIANHFEYWRGSIVYKFKFVKTEFHSGRLSITFNPNNAVVAPHVTPTLADSSYIHRQVIDIREANEFTFVIPFISDSPYKNVGSVAACDIGTFSIRVLDPLVAPATVAQTISIIVEKCAGPDIEFAVPSQCNYTYFAGITPQSGNVFGSVDQGSSVCSNLNTTIGSSLIKGDNSLNSLHCIGEKISSFRALLKLPQQLLYVTPPVAANYHNVIPFCITAGSVSGVTNTFPSVLNDLYSRIASCYVYSRGGVRLKFVDNMSVTTTQPVFVALDNRGGSAGLNQVGFQWTNLNAAGTSNATDRTNMPVVFYRAGYSGEVQVPQYHRFHSRVNSDCCVSIARPYNLGNLSLAPNIYVTRGTLPLSTTLAETYRSFSDDANFGSFLSVPPMTFTTISQV
jgi:hypothetical protein